MHRMRQVNLSAAPIACFCLHTRQAASKHDVTNLLLVYCHYVNIMQELGYSVDRPCVLFATC